MTFTLGWQAFNDHASYLLVQGTKISPGKGIAVSDTQIGLDLFGKLFVGIKTLDLLSHPISNLPALVDANGERLSSYSFNVSFIDRLPINSAVVSGIGTLGFITFTPSKTMIANKNRFSGATNVNFLLAGTADGAPQAFQGRQGISRLSIKMALLALLLDLAEATLG